MRVVKTLATALCVFAIISGQVEVQIDDYVVGLSLSSQMVLTHS